MRINNEKGASIVEFALILPILLILLFGIIEFGFYIFNKSIITNASREGARAGIVYAYSDDSANSNLPNLRISSQEIIDRVEHYIANNIVNFCSDKAPINVIISPENPTKLPSGDDLSVSVNFNYCFLLVPSLTGISDNVTLTATTIMRAE